MTKLQQLTKKIALTFMTLAGISMIPMVCLADARGFQPFSGGLLYHRIDGSGRRVDFELANYKSKDKLCNTGVKFTYGNHARASQTLIRKGCSTENEWEYSPHTNMEPGSACAQLWADTWKKFIAEQCHQITD